MPRKSESRRDWLDFIPAVYTLIVLLPIGVYYNFDKIIRAPTSVVTICDRLLLCAALVLELSRKVVGYFSYAGINYFLSIYRRSAVS